MIGMGLKLTDNRNRGEYIRGLVFRKLRQYLHITNAAEITRRYLVMNGFDGALTTLGIVMAFYVSGRFEPAIVLSAGFGATFAMAISGASGAFLTERAERTRSIKEMERAIYADLGNSIVGRASRATVILVAFVDAVAPLLAGLLVLSPFVLSLWQVLEVNMAFLASIVLDLGFLFFLGIMLGRSAKANMLVYGFMMVSVGFLVALIFIFFRISVI